MYFLQQHCSRDALLEKIKEIVNLVIGRHQNRVLLGKKSLDCAGLNLQFEQSMMLFLAQKTTSLTVHNVYGGDRPRKGHFRAKKYTDRF